MLQTLADWTLRLDVDAILRGQGMDPAAVRARSARIVAAAENTIDEGRALLSPLVISRELTVTGHEPDRLLFGAAVLPCGPVIAKRLRSAEHLVAIAATIGPALDEVAIDMVTKEPMRALAIHGIGGAAVEDLAEQACRRFREQGRADGFLGAIPCWPGRPEWPNHEAQRQIFDLLDLDEGACAAIDLTASHLMRPAKSLSFVIGLSQAPDDEAATCDGCGLRPDCPYLPVEE